MIACAGDEIIADQSSIVGSIGVISASFGFQGLLDKIGVERRVHTAGRSKSMLDPFKPEKPEDVARLRELQDEVHAAFIDLVKARRGAALKDDPDLFGGLLVRRQGALARPGRPNRRPAHAAQGALWREGKAEAGRGGTRLPAAPPRHDGE
jgi:ClpP class serine protease